MNSTTLTRLHEPGPGSPHEPKRYPRRILLIEGNVYLCHLTADILIRHGFEVNATDDPSAAFKELKTYEYNLLITEQNLPKLSGFGLVKKLRSVRMHLPVILASESFPAGKAIRQPWLQPARTLLKPYAIADLLGKVTELLHAADYDPTRPSPPSSPRAALRPKSPPDMRLSDSIRPPRQMEKVPGL